MSERPGAWSRMARTYTAVAPLTIDRLYDVTVVLYTPDPRLMQVGMYMYIQFVHTEPCLCHTYHKSSSRDPLPQTPTTESQNDGANPLIAQASVTQPHRLKGKPVHLPLYADPNQCRLHNVQPPQRPPQQSDNVDLPLPVRTVIGQLPGLRVKIFLLLKLLIRQWTHD
jgi:hypothetical protein